MRYNFRKNWQLTILFMLFVPFLVFQITIINRPFYWDEAWSYASAVESMYQKGPSLLPGAIQDYLYRGHPTFFYFITTIWMKVFGPSLISIHSFFLIVSTCLVFAVFAFGNFLGGKTVGLIASACLIATPLFIAQAGFLLPEVMLALFSVLTVYYYFKQKIILEIVFGILLLYTKETGIVIIASILLFDFIKRINHSESFIEFFKGLIHLSKHLSPIALVAVFFIAQKTKVGWFFFPEHMGMMTFDIKTFYNKFINISRYVFQLEGRLVLTLVLLILLVFSIVRKRINIEQKNYLLITVIIFVFYISFSALNFYTVRYTMSIFPFLFLLFGIVINSAFKNYSKALIYIPVIAFMALSLKYSVKPEGVGDRTIGFLKMVDVHKKTVAYCEDVDLYDKEIGTHFLMLYNLKSTFMGYLSKGRIFRKTVGLGEPYPEVVIISNIELNEHAKAIQKSEQYQLLKRFENGLAWCEIYEKKENF